MRTKIEAASRKIEVQFNSAPMEFPSRSAAIATSGQTRESPNVFGPISAGGTPTSKIFRVPGNPVGFIRTTGRLATK